MHVISYHRLMGLLLASAVCLSLGCATADLRPEAPPLDGAEAQGRALLAGLADAHGGRDAWLRQDVVRATVSDHWKPLMHTVAGPWPSNGTPFEITFVPGKDSGRIHFLEEEEPDWGLQNWRTYTVEKGGEPEFDDDDRIKFWIPTTSYFIEAPFRLVEATTVYRIEPKVVEGKHYERVFLTWGDDAPRDDVDQYVAWIDPDTNRLAWLQYTIRDYGDWMVGIMAYEELTETGGFVVARKMGTVDEPGGERTLHQYRVHDLDLAPDVSRSFVIPRPELRGEKY